MSFWPREKPFNLNCLPSRWDLEGFDKSQDFRPDIQAHIKLLEKQKAFYSQFGEDKKIFTHAINQPLFDGTFLELGAHDGVDKSNTKFLEETLGFSRGMLIEPHPLTYEKLVKNRPNCINLNYAIHPTSSSVDLMACGRPEVTTVNDGSAGQEFLDKWHGGGGKADRVISVKGERLDNLLKKHKFDFLDFWSLDVEGFELSVLKTMDWSIPVGLLCIESYHPCMKECHELLISHGLEYRPLVFPDGAVTDHPNHYYINPSYFRLDKFFGPLNWLK